MAVKKAKNQAQVDHITLPKDSGICGAWGGWEWGRGGFKIRIGWKCVSVVQFQDSVWQMEFWDGQHDILPLIHSDLLHESMDGQSYDLLLPNRIRQSWLDTTLGSGYVFCKLLLHKTRS